MSESVLIQFVDNEDKPITDSMQVPLDISLEHLRQIHATDVSNSLFVNGLQIVSDLQSCLSKLQISKEETVLIKTVKDIQNIRPALFCNSSFSGHEQAVLKVKILNQNMCVTAGGDGTLRFWDLNSKTSIQILKISEHWVLCLDVCDNYILAGSMDGNLSLIDCTTFGIRNFKNHSKGISAVAINKMNDKYILVSGGRDSKVFILEENGNILGSYTHSGPVDCITMKGQILASVGRKADMKISKCSDDYQIQTIKEIKTHIKRINDIKMHKNLLITASDDCRVNIHDMDNHFAVKKQLLHKNIVISTAVSANSQFIATASFDKTVRLWDFASGNCLATYFHVDSVYKVLFSHNLLISISKDKTIKLFCTKTKKVVSEMVCGDEIFDFDCLGRIIVCGCRDRKVYFFA